MKGLLGLGLGLVLIASAGWDSAGLGISPPNPNLAKQGSVPGECVLGPVSPDYYQIRLVGTKKVRGSRMAKGMGEVTFASSPFGVALSETGTYVVNLDLAMSNVTLDEGMSLAAWVTTPQIDQTEAIGIFDDAFQIQGSTEWNKFLVVITLEPKGKPLGPTWTGPIVARGMSRSGLMHTMAGHGPFETEPCAVYGF